MAVRHRGRAIGRGRYAVADPGRAVDRNGATHARAADERGACRAPRHVHRQHGHRIEGTCQARRAGDASQRRRGRRDDGRAVRGQDGHDYDEPVGDHGRDSTWPCYRRRGSVCRCTRLSGSQPRPDRPRLSRRSEGATRLRRAAQDRTDFVCTVRR